MKQPKILATGATGKTGRAVLDELLAKGVPVRAVVHSQDARSGVLERQGADTVVADMFDPDQLLAAMRETPRAYYLPVYDPYMSRDRHRRLGQTGIMGDGGCLGVQRSGCGRSTVCVLPRTACRDTAGNTRSCVLPSDGTRSAAALHSLSYLRAPHEITTGNLILYPRTIVEDRRRVGRAPFVTVVAFGRSIGGPMVLGTTVRLAHGDFTRSALPSRAAAADRRRLRPRLRGSSRSSR
jgi:hypothetical protein